MKLFIIIFMFLFSTISFAQNDEVEVCKLGVYGGHRLKNLRDQISVYLGDLREQIKNSLHGNMYTLQIIQLLPSKDKKMYCQHLDCSKKKIKVIKRYKGVYSKQDTITVMKEKLVTKLSEMYHNAVIPYKICDSLTQMKRHNDLYEFISDTNKMFKHCKSSRKPYSVVAEKLDVPYKHLKSIKDLKAELNEFHEIKTTKSKSCSIIPLVHKISEKQKSKLKMCESSIKFVNEFHRLKEKCQ